MGYLNVESGDPKPGGSGDSLLDEETVREKSLGGLTIPGVAPNSRLERR